MVCDMLGSGLTMAVIMMMTGIVGTTALKHSRTNVGFPLSFSFDDGENYFLIRTFLHKGEV